MCSKQILLERKLWDTLYIYEYTIIIARRRACACGVCAYVCMFALINVRKRIFRSQIQHFGNQPEEFVRGYVQVAEFEMGSLYLGRSGLLIQPVAYCMNNTH